MGRRTATSRRRRGLKSIASFEAGQFLFNRGGELVLPVLRGEPLAVVRPLDPFGLVARSDVRDSERKQVLRRPGITRLGDAREFDYGFGRAAKRDERSAEVEARKPEGRLAL